MTDEQHVECQRYMSIEKRRKTMATLKSSRRNRAHGGYIEYILNFMLLCSPAKDQTSLG